MTQEKQKKNKLKVKDGLSPNKRFSLTPFSQAQCQISSFFGGLRNIKSIARPYDFFKSYLHSLSREMFHPFSKGELKLYISLFISIIAPTVLKNSLPKIIGQEALHSTHYERIQFFSLFFFCFFLFSFFCFCFYVFLFLFYFTLYYV